jgi:hypothetical protein
MISTGEGAAQQALWRSFILTRQLPTHCSLFKVYVLVSICEMGNHMIDDITLKEESNSICEENGPADPVLPSRPQRRVG